MHSTIYIAVDKYSEIIPQLSDIEQEGTDYFWFDIVRNYAIPVTDILGDCLSDNFCVEMQGLTVIYDLRIAPLTYDVANFLADCELERQDRKLSFINVLLVPEDERRIKKGQNENKKQLELRIQGIFFPLTNQFNCPVYLKHCATRKEARAIWNTSINRYPSEHDFLSPTMNYLYSNLLHRVNLGQSLNVLKTPDDVYVSIVDNWALSNNIDLKKLITISLRESSIQHGRNSNISEWIKFAKSMRDNGYEIVFIRVTEKAFSDEGLINVFLTFPLACFDLGVRRALYTKCFVNLMVNNGVAALTFLDSNIRYIIFRMVNELYGYTTAAYLKSIGLDVGNNYVGSMPWQQICWEDDDSHVVSTGQLTSEREILACAAMLLGYTPIFADKGLNETCIDKKTGVLIAIVNSKFFRKHDYARAGNPNSLKNATNWSPTLQMIDVVEQMLEHDKRECAFV
jgi:hypothetical protein